MLGKWDIFCLSGLNIYFFYVLCKRPTWSHQKTKQSVINYVSWCCCVTDVLQGRDLKDSTTVQSPTPHTGFTEDIDVRNLCVGIPKVIFF